MVLELFLQLDQGLFNLLQHVRSPLVTEFFIQITDIGSLTFMLLVVVGLVLLDRKDEAVLSLIGVGVSGGLVWITKNIIGRERPEIAGQFVAHPLGSYAFPSGHTTLAFVMATILAAKFPRIRELVYVTAGLIAVSRVYLGVHFLTDILAGAVLGVIVGRFVLRYEKNILSKLS